MKGNNMLKSFFVILLAISLTACGPRGNVGPQGSAGIQGPAGPKGDTGVAGAPGIDAASIKVVQLCPGIPTYPSTFIEVAFCIDSKLYATYSANGGFSTEITPGSYTSAGIGSSCNFVVGVNCEVTNE